MITKTCTVCNESKTLDQFHKDKASSDGHQYRCKACKKAYMATYNAEHREQDNARSTAYQAEHRDEAAAYKQTPKGRFTTYKGSAKTRAISFDLTFDEFLVYWGADCSYCGKAIATIGIDRIDSNIGYAVGNCVPCCTVCNMMKSDHGTDFWLDHMLQVLRTQEVI